MPWSINDLTLALIMNGRAKYKDVDGGSTGFQL
jgi:hypothetical protein